jgi:[ribosomal protein S18]-alanine N-acetyltransferase
VSATLPPSRTELWIRPLRSTDLADVVEIERKSFSTPWKESTFRNLLQRTDTDMLGAVHRGQLAGYAISWTVSDQSELGNVAVACQARGVGVGRLLVLAILDRVRERGAAECFLEVRESNRIAQSLYESIGFQTVGRRRAYYNSPTEDAKVMRFDLR